MTLGLLSELMMLGEPRFHGNGFTQLYLNDMTRLHVWDPALPPYHAHNATTHTHRYDMESTVLLGKVVHRTYDVARDGPDLFLLSDQYHVNRRDTDHALVYDHPVSCNFVGRSELAAGSTYTFAHGCFHDSDGTERAATLMHRVRMYDENPLVLVPRGEDPLHAFVKDEDHPVNPIAMWAAIERALLDMNYWDRVKIEKEIS